MVRPILAIAISLTLSGFVFAEKKKDEFVINLKDPTYSEGIIETENGGVITAQDLRIQARHIRLVRKKDKQTIEASCDLMMEYCGRIFVGECLEFDLNCKTGFLTDGRTQEGDWFIGGDLIEFNADGTYSIQDAFITTSTGRSNYWEIKAHSATVTDANQVHAKDVQFRALDVPLLWLPSYSTNLDKFRSSPIRYRFLYDKGVGPRISARYRFFSTDTFSAFARADLRFDDLFNDGKDLKLRPGGALEFDYLSPSKRTVFQSNNYASIDQIFRNEENKGTRYRFQGIYKTKSKDERTRFHVQWDKLSDSKMVSDFKDPDFEINTQKTTYLELSDYRDWTFTNLTVRPLLNKFQTLAQELPTGIFGVHPANLWVTGIITENYVNGSYLDYTFANVTKVDLKEGKKSDFPKDRSSGRLETLNSIYRPFSLGGLTLTPRVGLAGIYYSNSPSKNAIGQLAYLYGGDANIRFSRSFQSFKHTVIPYAKYLGISQPQAPVDDYFVFSIHDGYDRLDQCQFGLKQLIFTDTNSIFLPRLVLDLYGYSFWGAQSFDQRIPKVFANLEYNQQSYALLGGVGWNIQEGVLDYGNAEFLWTVSANLALGVEIRHRSKFWWRKSIHENFVVDFARPLDELLASPLSDQRNTFLTKAHFRLTNRWNLQLQTFHGWGRTTEGPYNGAKVDLYTMLTGKWQMKLTYEYMPNDPIRFSYSFKLIN